MLLLSLCLLLGYKIKKYLFTNQKTIIMKRISLLLMFAVAVFFIACGPSVDGEKESWASNKKNLTKIKTDHSFYAKIIDEKIKEAEKIWKEAEGISDEDKKAEKMQKANDLLENGCVGNLNGMKGEISRVETKIEEVIRKQRSAKKGKYYADEKIDEARDAVKYAEKVFMEEKNCSEIQSRYKGLKTAYADLGRAITRMESSSSSNSSTNRNKSTINKGGSNSSSGKTKTPDTPKKVKCSYCGSMNSASATKCSSCGAPVD